MMKNNNVVQSLAHAIFVTLYIWGVVNLMQNMQNLIGADSQSILIPIAMLMLFVVSATIVGAFVLGRPGIMYLAGQRKEAFQFFAYTVGWLLIITIALFIILVQVR